MLRLSNISKGLLERERFGIVPVRYAEGTIQLFVPDPKHPDLYAWSTKWEEGKNGALKLKSIEVTIPARLTKSSNLRPYLIGRNTYLLPEVIFDKMTGKWKNLDKY